MGLGEAVLHLRQLEQFPEGKSFQDHVFKINFSGKLSWAEKHTKRPTLLCPHALGPHKPCCLFFVFWKTPHPGPNSYIQELHFSPFPGSVACGLGFPSSLVLTPPTTPLLGEPENSQTQPIMAYYGFLTGEASHMKRVAVSLFDGGLCYFGSRPITADPTSFQEHSRKKNDLRDPALLEI